MCKLSVITINYNNAKGLQKTIESVINQTCDDFEYIIIDGGSDDNSLEIIKKYEKHITYWVSEKDDGIYNAMNKGIKQAKGEYCLFLNSGDYLFNNLVLQSTIGQGFNEDIVFGNINTEKGIVNFPNILTILTFLNGTICHQAIFHKTDLFKKYSLYDEKLTIVADWEFLFKTIIIHNCSYRHINQVICYYDITGISSNPEFKEKLKKQKEEVFKAVYKMRDYDYELLLNEKNELQFYRGSKLVQLAKKIQQSSLYKKIRKIK